MYSYFGDTTLGSFRFIEEYWIGDPPNKALEILTLKHGRSGACAGWRGKPG